MIGIQLHPVDTWFFRSGVPFTADSAPQENVKSLFPPYPPTLVGALRAALARGRGWKGRGNWTREIRDVLGDGPNDLGQVSIDGPFLLHDGQPLFPVPRHLLGVTEEGGWCPKALLRPGEPVRCDLGDEVRLPVVGGSHSEVETFKTGDDQWLTTTGLTAALRGVLPGTDDIVPSSRLWSWEARIGLERDTRKRTAKEGMLYSTQQVRLAAGVSLGARVSGLPEDWKLPWEDLVPLGGEGRLAGLVTWDAELGIDLLSGDALRRGKVAVLALSPLDIDHDVYVGKTPIEELGGAHVVSACLDRPQRIGGWDSRPQSFGPLPIRSVLPPGSVLFCEMPDRERFEAMDLMGSGLVRIGARTEWGFGLATLGVWPN